MSVFITDSNGKLVKVAGGTEGFSLPIGSIFSSAIPLNDASVHLLDGSLISQVGMYAEFAQLIKSLDAEGKQICCTQAQYESDLSTYGQCGKFVIDNTAGTIRLPYIKEFIASNNSGQIIGVAELDTFKAHTHTTSSSGSHSHSFVARTSKSSISNDWGTNGTNIVTNDGSGGSKSSLINSSGAHTHTANSTGDTETKPKNIRYPYYIVLANGYKSNELVNINNIVSDVNLKQDKLVANSVALNTTRAGQNDTVIEYYMSSDGNTWYRKWASGWKECGITVLSNGSGTCNLPLTFSNVSYIVVCTCSQPSGASDMVVRSTYIVSKGTSNFVYREPYAYNGETKLGADNQMFYCCGF